MLQNPCKMLGFKKNMVYEIPPGGEVNHIQPVAYRWMLFDRVVFLPLKIARRALEMISLGLVEVSLLFSRNCRPTLCNLFISRGETFAFISLQ